MKLPYSTGESQFAKSVHTNCMPDSQNILQRNFPTKRFASLLS